MTRFTDFPLHPATQAALAAMAIDTPTPIQDAALPHLLAGRDLVGQARTGSGKTLAFGIPLVERVDPRERAVQALVLTPTRELATQVGAVVEQLGRGRRIATTLIYGGVGFGPQETALRRGAQVVVGTPGRVLDLIRRGVLALDRVRFLVLDEADEMLDRGFAPDVERILAHVARDRQTALFSATVPPWVLETGAKHLRRPVTVRVDPAPEDVPAIEHTVYDVPAGAKLDVLKKLLDARGDGATIVFGRTKHGVKKLGKQLAQLGYPVAALQGNLSQNARDRVMADFRSGATEILLATNVAARGIDVAAIEQVINFDLPESAELLTHRVGRTGRMGRQGRAITLLAPEDGPKWRQLERALGRGLPRFGWRDEYAAIPPDIAAPHPPQPAARPAAPSRPDAMPRAASPRPAHTQPSRPAQAAPETSRVRHAVTCAACGRETTVPFVPRTGRPLYCSDCFRRERRPGGTAPTGPHDSARSSAQPSATMGD
ncbi:MAG TPA: DEAD/DEAH box helicase [Thermomicrobiales bacterium]|nr:DEAD/DEAH box helicase [Thermomicrobiales bacterium]